MSLARTLAPVLFVALSLSLASPAAAQDVYPTDQCVADKFDAAGDQCRRVLKAWAKWEKKGDKSARTNKINKANHALRAEWKTANQTSSAAGAKCNTTTAGGGDMAKVVKKGGKTFAKYVSGSLDLGEEQDGPCASRYLKAAADACRDLLGAEGAHIAGRDTDRDKAVLNAARDAAWGGFQTAWDEIEADSCGGEANSEDASEQLASLIDAVEWAGTVTTQVDTEGWDRIVPATEVNYAGRMLDPQCWDGAEYNFFAQRGTVNKLIVYYQGGGACWNGATCGGVPEFGVNPTFKQTTGPGDNPENFTGGLAGFEDPENPFTDWHKVFVPYCTGDVHWGDATVVHTLDIRDTVVNHKGYVNAQVVEKWTREHFANPEQVFMTGSSAGAYGAIVNSLPLKEKVYPSTPFAVVGDAGNGVITDEFLEEDLSKWGIENNLPDWIPAFNVPIEDLDAADLWAESAAFYPDSRYGTFTTAYDGSSGGQTGFYNIMANLDNPLLWGSWWGSSCDWNPLMVALNEDAGERADNYRYYIASGSAHTTWGRDRVYTDTTGGVPQTFVEWLTDMLDGSDEDWQNVTCEDCTILQEGDPVPPVEGEARPFPFETEGFLICDEG